MYKPEDRSYPAYKWSFSLLRETLGRISLVRLPLQQHERSCQHTSPRSERPPVYKRSFSLLREALDRGRSDRLPLQSSSSSQALRHRKQHNRHPHEPERTDLRHPERFVKEENPEQQADCRADVLEEAEHVEWQEIRSVRE